MLMILLSTLSVIRHQIYKTLWNEAGNGLLVLMLETILFYWSVNTDANDIKMDGSVFEEKPSFEMLGLSSTFEPDQDYWCTYKISIALTASKITGALICYVKFFSAEAALYKSSTRSCMQYCSDVWTDTPSRFLEMLDKLQNLICKAVGPSLPVCLEPLVHCKNVASLNLFYRQ